MADELDDLPTHKDKAREYTQRFKRNNPPGTSVSDYVVYAVATHIDDIDHHFGAELQKNIQHKIPPAATGIRVYKGTEKLGTRRFYLVFTHDDPSIHTELLEHVFRLKKVSFDLDDIAKRDHSFTSHLVCQPNCPTGSSLFSDT
jgi:hypothetical protein